MASSFFAQNIKLLRKRRGRTQDELAFSLGMKRPTLAGYENQVAEPGVEQLLAFSTHFGVAVDTLLKVDLSSLGESQLSQLERGYDVFIRGSNLRVLATTVDRDNEENIELVPEKAKAGYTTGFADPDYIKVLPAFHLPFLSRDRKYRSFQVSGDSMEPIPDGAWVTGEFVQDWSSVRDRQAYIILTLEDGIVFKVVENLIHERNSLMLHSLNPAYQPYEVDIRDIREMWRFVNFISPELPQRNMPREEIAEAIAEIRTEVRQIRQLMLDL
jgi:transcriptional regulator with XRE-family HTH domain